MNAYIARCKEFLAGRATAVGDLCKRLALRPAPLWVAACGLALGLLTGGLLGRMA